MGLLPLPADTGLLAAQLNELTLRERVSAAIGIAAILTVAWVHAGAVPQENMVGWLCFMCLVQGLRLWHSGHPFDFRQDHAFYSRWRNVRVVLNVLNGLGWGMIWLVLDSEWMDFLFMFKFGALAAALGVTGNALSVVLPVYVGFVTPVIVLTTGFLLTNTPFLTLDQRLSLCSGVLAYYAVLMVIARNASVMTRRALEQGFEREMALAESQQSHQRELALRERLQDESRQLEEANRKLNEANERLFVSARQDALTGLYNRRHLVERLEHEVHAIRRYGKVFSIIILDVDHFKNVNDTLGHQVGDLVLVGLAKRFSGVLREIDVFGRWGGEEFLCLLPSTGFDEAFACAERLCADLDAAHLVATHPDLHVTASFGVVSCTPEDNVDSVMSRVDSALYAAKAAGRNRVLGMDGAALRQA